jgi:sugar diacid utilization regulator
VLARFLIERVAMAAETALRNDDDVRPRGAGRAVAIRALMERTETSPSDRRRSAVALGLEPDGVYLVAVTPKSQEPLLSRALEVIGSAHDAGEVDRDHLWLVAVSTTSGPEHVAVRAQQLKRIWTREQPDRSLRLALSAPTVGVAGLPAAADEARFIAALQRSEKLQRQAASFDSLDDLGALRVLYQLRQSPELRQFVEQVLGSLAGRETLRSTLKVFLESGGSQVEASKRLGIHRNTLSYRLRRVAALIGVDVTDPEAWLTLHLAISAADLFRLTSSES